MSSQLTKYLELKGVLIYIVFPRGKFLSNLATQTSEKSIFCLQQYF